MEDGELEDSGGVNSAVGGNAIVETEHLGDRQPLRDRFQQRLAHQLIRVSKLTTDYKRLIGQLNVESPVYDARCVEVNYDLAEAKMCLVQVGLYLEVARIKLEEVNAVLILASVDSTDE